VTGVNDPPVAVNDSYTTVQNTVLNGSTVLVNDSDPDSQSLTAQIVTQPSSGSVVLQSNGTFAYTPANNFTGTVTFTYRVSDGTASSNIATVTIVVTAANRPPVAVNDSYSTDKNVALTIAAPGILSNDSDPDAGNTITASLVSGTAASTGTVTLNGNGSFTFTPANNYTGTTTFRYRVRDNLNAQSNEATVTIVVNNLTSAGRVCYDGGSGMTNYRAQIDWERQTNGDIKARATVGRNYTDNTYGVNKVGWGNKKRDFKAVYLSDYGQLAFYDASGSKKIDFKIDLLSARTGTPSGYATLGVSGGDGAMVSGSASNIVSLDTSMNQNMNAFGYVTTSSSHPLKSYSPSTNTSYTPNATYPLWIWDVWYEATIKGSTFGASGFGTVTLRGLHASPPKADVSSWRLINCQ
jgi:VCBS repeat-containing protein